jgi:hypothetical protein
MRVAEPQQLGGSELLVVFDSLQRLKEMFELFAVRGRSRQSFRSPCVSLAIR